MSSGGLSRDLPTSPAAKAELSKVSWPCGPPPTMKNRRRPGGPDRLLGDDLRLYNAYSSNRHSTSYRHFRDKLSSHPFRGASSTISMNPGCRFASLNPGLFSRQPSGLDSHAGGVPSV